MLSVGAICFDDRIVLFWLAVERPWLTLAGPFLTLLAQMSAELPPLPL